MVMPDNRKTLRTLQVPQPLELGCVNAAEAVVVKKNMSLCLQKRGGGSVRLLDHRASTRKTMVHDGTGIGGANSSPKQRSPSMGVATRAVREKKSIESVRVFEP